MMFEDQPGKFESFMAEHADEIKTPEDEARLKAQFIREYNEMNEKRRMQGPVTAEDYLELAAQATTKKKQREYLAEALGLEPENLEAKLQMLMLDAKNPLEAAAQMEQLVAEGTEQMRKAGYLKNDVGSSGWSGRRAPICGCSGTMPRCWCSAADTARQWTPRGRCCACAEAITSAYAIRSWRSMPRWRRRSRHADSF